LNQIQKFSILEKIPKAWSGFNYLCLNSKLDWEFEKFSSHCSFGLNFPSFLDPPEPTQLGPANLAGLLLPGRPNRQQPLHREMAFSQPVSASALDSFLFIYVKA
jgi:hypothetical protein